MWPWRFVYGNILNCRLVEEEWTQKLFYKSLKLGVEEEEEEEGNASK